jgi:hypothetical protein
MPRFLVSSGSIALYCRVIVRVAKDDVLSVAIAAVIG